MLNKLLALFYDPMSNGDSATQTALAWLILSMPITCIISIEWALYQIYLIIVVQCIGLILSKISQHIWNKQHGI